MCVCVCVCVCGVCVCVRERLSTGHICIYMYISVDMRAHREFNIIVPVCAYIRMYIGIY